MWIPILPTPMGFSMRTTTPPPMIWRRSPGPFSPTICSARCPERRPTTNPRSATVSQELFISSKNQLLPGKPYAYADLVGSKTGYTSEARQTLVSCAQRDGMKLICVVMKEEAPAQFTDTVELFNYGFSSFHMINVADADSRYTVGNELFFESDADVFGSSSPILSIDPSDFHRASGHGGI